MSLDARDTPAGVSLRVRVQPRASRAAIAGERDGALLLRVTAPPVDGAANDAVARLLGRALGVPPSAVRIASGDRRRDKRVVVEGVSAARILSLASPPSPRKEKAG